MRLCLWRKFFGRKKGSLKWFIDGDRNTKFFSDHAKCKTSCSSILKLYDNDVVLEKPEHIEEYILNYYEKLYNANSQIDHDSKSCY